MRGTHEHSRFTVIMGGPNKSGHDGRVMACANQPWRSWRPWRLKNLGLRFRGDERINLGRGRGSRGQLGLDLALDLAGAGGKLVVAGLDQVSVEATAEIQRAQRRIGDAQVEALA